MLGETQEYLELKNEEISACKEYKYLKWHSHSITYTYKWHTICYPIGPRNLESVIFLYGTVRIFNERHQNENVGLEYVMELVRKCETGSVSNKKSTVKKVLDEASQIHVLRQFAMNPTLSIPKMSRMNNTSKKRFSMQSVHSA